jgi:c(7)-type cytochrome triheme protein
VKAVNDRRGRGRWYILLLPLFFAVSCSDETLSLFFDVTPPTAQEKAAEAAAKRAEAKAAAARTGETAVAEEEGERPEIEAILDWEQASEMLPKDDMDEVDWMAALRQEIIKPRAQITGQGDPKANLFKFDFYFAGPDPESDAFFPHSSHTEWLTCESCHPAIFPYRELGLATSGTPDEPGQYSISMDQVFEGEYCGKCHGTVAFVLDSCNRCHTKM